MKTETVKLSQIQVNGANPRTISNEKFEKLINSVLVLPKMLELRPIVVDDTFVALGGNMRYRALSAIDGMSVEEIADRLSGLRDYQKKTEAERQQLVEYWDAWKANPIAPIIKASELSEDERKEFIVKDNVGFGSWNFDMLANEWDSLDLDDWGVDVWQPDDWGDSGIELREDGDIRNTAEELNKIKIGSTTIYFTKEEKERIEKSIERYAQEFGIMAGYINYLMDIEDGKQNC